MGLELGGSPGKHNHETQRSYAHQINYSLLFSQLRSLVDLVSLMMKKGLQRITGKVQPKEQKVWTEAQHAGKHHVKWKTTGRGQD